MTFLGHIPDKPPVKAKPAKTFTKKLPDYMAYIRQKKRVEQLDICRQFFCSTQTARVLLVDLAKKGNLRKLPKASVREKDVYEYVEGT